jgi:hypothetical protein
LTFFGLNANEIAVDIQLRSHFKNNQTGAMSQKRAK